VAELVHAMCVVVIVLARRIQGIELTGHGYIRDRFFISPNTEMEQTEERIEVKVK